ncbi:MAG: glycosyltransferase [Clostridium perfringens]|uniref:glycosyltransferase n=2 Tax=Clostridium perfringens TaxID=1502 RepID=UPI001FABDE5B|nr:glycosyltransferase [Clostridium perfringens]
MEFIKRKNMSKKNKKATVVGHFAEGKNLLNGQTVKTKIVYNELVRIYGKKQVDYIDTHGGAKVIIKALFKCIKKMNFSDNFIIMPAENGLRVFAPFLSLLNCFFNKRLHYVVIGGWLPDFLKNKIVLSFVLRKFSGIYVETNFMKKLLEKDNFHNVFIMSNCKNLDILSADKLIYSENYPFKLCTFSRVMKEKGIEDAINAVTYINKRFNMEIFSLDIYGQIEEEQQQWFESIMKGANKSIKYKGLVSYNESTNVLKKYYALLFPTFYQGEGFAGTLIDAMAAGVPVIASDWKYNSEIIIKGKNGILIENDLISSLMYIKENVNEWNELKINCLEIAKKYVPEVALEILVKKML